MKRFFKTQIQFAFLFAILLAASAAFAHEGVGRAGGKEEAGVEVESEFYVGRRGYLHGGLGVVSKINDMQHVGIVGHFVREETGEKTFPSLGAEFIQHLGNDFEVEAYSFGYFPVEKQHAWAVGLRGQKQFQFCEEATISPFFGPAYARVRAIDEISLRPVEIGHLMLLGGFTVECGALDLTVFGSHSFFSRSTSDLETHVDLEEMTHFAAYENNDGFARNTGGAEVSFAFTDCLSLAARYALILYKDETRHSIALAPTVSLGERCEAFGGVQLLRGSGRDNDLIMGGVALRF